VFPFTAQSPSQFTKPVDAWGSSSCLADIADLCCDILEGDPISDSDIRKEFRSWVVDSCKHIQGLSKVRGQVLRFRLVFNRVGKSRQYECLERKNKKGDP